jgi:hypothetical protein
MRLMQHTIKNDTFLQLQELGFNQCWQVQAVEVLSQVDFGISRLQVQNFAEIKGSVKAPPKNLKSMRTESCIQEVASNIMALPSKWHP